MGRGLGRPGQKEDVELSFYRSKFSAVPGTEPPKFTQLITGTHQRRILLGYRFCHSLGWLHRKTDGQPMIVSFVIATLQRVGPSGRLYLSISQLAGFMVYFLCVMSHSVEMSREVTD